MVTRLSLRIDKQHPVWDIRCVGQKGNPPWQAKVEVNGILATATAPTAKAAKARPPPAGLVAHLLQAPPRGQASAPTPAKAVLCLPSPTTQKECARQLLTHPSFAEALQQMAAAAAGHGPVAEAYALRAGLLALLRMAGRDLVDGRNVGVAAAVVAWAQDASLEFPPELLAGIIASMQLHGLVAADKLRVGVRAATGGQ
jgi:hypothetical protein